MLFSKSISFTYLFFPATHYPQILTFLHHVARVVHATLGHQRNNEAMLKDIVFLMERSVGRCVNQANRKLDFFYII